MSDSPSPRRTLHVTGKLAETALRDVLATNDLPGEHEVAVMKITVAALMTTSWIAKRLELPAGVDRVLLPGMVQGDVAVLEDATGVEVVKGPADVQELPRWFGLQAVRAELGPRDVRVFAEINEVGSLTRGQILDRADRHRDEGADVIDLGVSLDTPWIDEGRATIAALLERGHVLSIDTLDPDMIRMADEAGVSYVLSLTPATVGLAEDLRATPVLVPEDPDDLGPLDDAIATLERLGKPFIVDPILAPITSGFSTSLGRYLDVRRRHPDVEMLMGIGNLTELTEADSSGVTALLIGFCQEQRIHQVLTTSVIGWAGGAVREAVLASQTMHLAQRRGRPPKHLGGALVTARDEDRREPTVDELAALQEQVTDPNWRLAVSGGELVAYNGDKLVRGADLYTVFDALEVDDPTHAFYLGKELMKATIARGLGKAYRQEGPLDWGYLSFPEPQREDGRPRRRKGHPRGDAPASDGRAVVDAPPPGADPQTDGASGASTTNDHRESR